MTRDYHFISLFCYSAKSVKLGAYKMFKARSVSCGGMGPVKLGLPVKVLHTKKSEFLMFRQVNCVTRRKL